MKRLNEDFFILIELVFSAAVLVLFLLTVIDVAAARDNNSRILLETTSLAEENERLRAQTEERLSLEAIERYARETLGMQPLSPAQIIYLESPD